MHMKFLFLLMLYSKLLIVRGRQIRPTTKPNIQKNKSTQVSVNYSTLLSLVNPTYNRMFECFVETFNYKLNSYPTFHKNNWNVGVGVDLYIFNLDTKKIEPLNYKNGLFKFKSNKLFEWPKWF